LLYELLVGSVNVAFGRVLAKARAKAGLSQERLAEQAAVHRTYVSQIERGLKSPTLTVLFKICRTLNVPASSLVRRAETEIES